MILTTGGYVHAGDVYTLSFDKSGMVQPKGQDFFSMEGTYSKNTRYACTYNGTNYTLGMKFSKDNVIKFTNTSKATVVVVQGIKEETANIKFDDVEIKNRVDNAEGNINAGVYTITDVDPGEHKITRTSQLGLVYIQVEYTGSSMTQLTEPTIDFNKETGSVTISQTETNNGVYYTTDGTDPSTDNGTKYESEFTVEDGTTIKAIAIGDGTTTINSKVASYYALLKTVTIQKPVITSVNGTVAISCATPGTTFKYSVNGGEQQDYSYPFTLTEDGIVKAVASRENCTDVEGDEVNVTAVKNTVATKTIVLDWNKFDLTDYVKGTSNSVLNGKTGTDAEGYSIELNNNEKNWSALNKMTIDGTEYQSIKLSNGAENILHMPEGVKASRITFYSVINSTDNNTVCGWQNVNGAQEYKSIPMGALTKYPNADTEYDVRVYPLNNATDKISFTNAGLQMAFVIALDIVDEPAATTTDITIGTAKMATYSNTSAWEIPAGVQAYTAKYADNKIKLTEVTGTVPANTGVVLYGNAGTYTANLTTTDATLADNDLASTANAAYTVVDNTTYALVAEKDAQGNKTGKVCFGRLEEGSIVAQGKAYLTISDSSAAKQLSIDINGETTGINAVENATETQNDVYYTLGGQRTVKPLKGLYIHNGKKYMK